MVAAIVAALTARQHDDEEKRMTSYSQQDLSENWEFKILRSIRGFRNPETLRRVLREESRAGWILVEKFDDNRIRLKRPASARAGDVGLSFDAHRTWVGMRPPNIAILVLLLALAIAGVLLERVR